MTKLRPRDSSATIIRRQRQEIAFLRKQIDVLLDKVEHLTVDLAAERTAQQSAARRRTQDAISRASWSNRSWVFNGS